MKVSDVMTESVFTVTAETPLITRMDLARCAGYRVETRDGRIGSVAAVLPRAGRECGLLLVRTGLMSCRLSAIPFDEVESVDADKRRLVLRETPKTIREGAPSGARDRIVSRA